VETPPLTFDESVTTPERQLFGPLRKFQPSRFLLLAFAVILINFLALDGVHRDFSVPLSFSSDSLMFEMLVKGTMDHGWWWKNPSVSAPYEFHALAFPSNSNVDHVIVWFVSRFTSGIGWCINVSWMVMLIIAGISTAFCSEELGLSRTSSWLIGLLYAFAPYALYRHVDHFSLAVYLIPLPATTALLVALNRIPTGRLRWILIGGCGLIGLNYIYYAFFSVFFLALAAAASYTRFRSKPAVSFAAIGLFVVTLASGLNLLPSMYVWAKEGRPRILREKVPAESEVYGLKIRQLVSPVFESSIKPFRKWTEKEAAAQYPLETENMIDRLGFIATLGFLAILAAPLFGWRAKRSQGELVFASGQLALGGVLLATIGGFGSLFALLISPDIRGYNRITGFLSFFALLAVGVALDRLLRAAKIRSLPRAGLAAAVAIALFGLYDQTQALQSLNRAHTSLAPEFHAVENYVQRLEADLPAGSAVYQLPFRTYLNDEGIRRMRPYDHLKLSLVSHHLRWNYPAFSNEQVDFQEFLMKLPVPDFLQELKARGFRALLIDRNGFADGGTEITASCERLLGHGALAGTDRYVTYDLASLPVGPRTTTQVTNAPKTAAKPISDGLKSCSGPPLYNIDAIGNATAPLAGKLPTVSLDGQLTLSGWALDQGLKQAAGGVEVLVDDTRIYVAEYGRQRSDVAAYFKEPAYGPSGFSTSIPAKALGRGSHQIALRVLSPDRGCYSQSADTAIEIR
jgi:phosphoglycerol transferase